jgi:ornithine cyclodeaminase/alanine dehydrogenase-like protein (mu-crystallin family)
MQPYIISTGFFHYSKTEGITSIMKLRVLSSADVIAALPMNQAIEAIKSAFGQLSAGQAVMPLRTRLNTEKGVTLCMPAYLPQSRALAIKLASVYEANAGLGLPVITAAVLVFNPETGLPQAFMDGASLTAIRTGAAGGLAADLLSRRSAETVGIFGAGVQSRWQLHGVMSVRAIREIRILNRSPLAAQRLAAEISDQPGAPSVIIASTPRELIENSSIIITATASTVPLFDGNDLKEGSHVTAVGSHSPQARELDVTTVHRARVVVDSREACLAEAGEIIAAKAPIYAELGEIVNGSKQGRETEEEITLFKSVGVAAQDAAAAAWVLREAEEEGLGFFIEL